jgi:hypothetical protein
MRVASGLVKAKLRECDLEVRECGSTLRASGRNALKIPGRSLGLPMTKEELPEREPYACFIRLTSKCLLESASGTCNVSRGFVEASRRDGVPRALEGPRRIASRSDRFEEPCSPGVVAPVLELMGQARRRRLLGSHTRKRLLGELGSVPLHGKREGTGEVA